MNIPQIVIRLKELGEIASDANPGSGCFSGADYNTFVNRWPVENGEPPTKDRMIEVWNEITSEEYIAEQELKKMDKDRILLIPERKPADDTLLSQPNRGSIYLTDGELLAPKKLNIVVRASDGKLYGAELPLVELEEE